MRNKFENLIYKKIKCEKEKFYDILLIGDEQKSMIDKYLFKGELYAFYDKDLIGVCVLTYEGDEVYEIKNIAVYEKHQKMGYGTEILNCIFDIYKNKCKTILVGTGESPDTVGFYKKNGFVYSHRVKNFFIDNYDHIIFDGGVQLCDMIYFKRDLDKNY